MEHLQITKTRKKHSNQKNVLNQIDTKILSMNQVPYLLYRTFFQREHQQFGNVHGKSFCQSLIASFFSLTGHLYLHKGVILYSLSVLAGEHSSVCCWRSLPQHQPLPCEVAEELVLSPVCKCAHLGLVSSTNVL